MMLNFKLSHYQAETLIRPVGASPRSSPPVRRPAPSLSCRPNVRIDSPALRGTPTRTAGAVWVGRGGPWVQTRPKIAEHDPRASPPAGDAPVGASADARAHSADGGRDAGDGPPRAAARGWRHRRAATAP